MCKTIITNTRIYFFILFILLISVKFSMQTGQEIDLAEVCEELHGNGHCKWTCFSISWTNPGCGPNTIYCAKKRCQPGWSYQCCDYRSHTHQHQQSSELIQRKRSQLNNRENVSSFWKSRIFTNPSQSEEKESFQQYFPLAKNRSLAQRNSDENRSNELGLINYRYKPYSFSHSGGLVKDEAPGPGGAEIFDYSNYKK